MLAYDRIDSLSMMKQALFHKLSCDTTFSASKKNRILSLVKDTIFLNVRILAQRSNEKPRRIFH